MTLAPFEIGQSPSEFGEPRTPQACEGRVRAALARKGIACLDSHAG
jgi:hypothetical protein